MLGRVVVAIALCAVLGAPALAHDDEDVYTPPADSHVVDLTSDNFKFRVMEGHWLVKFYAPWCGHCKHLAPIWDEAAKELDGKMNIAKIDCTVHSDVCNAYGVRGYPTLKYFRSGVPREYRGGRTAESIVAYSTRVTGPAVGDVTAATLKTFTSVPGSKFVYFGAGVIAQDDVVMNVAERFIDSASFAMSGDESLTSKFAVTARPGLVAVRGDSKEDVEVYVGEWNSDEIGAWVAARLLPVLAEMTQSNAGDYMASELQTVLTIVDPSAGTGKSRALKIARDVAVALQGRFNFAWIDGLRLSDFVEQFELTAADLPQTVVWNSKDALFYNNKSIQSKADVLAFLDSVLAGNVEARGEGRGFVADTLRWLENVMSTMSPLWMVAIILASFAACGGCIYCVLSDSGEEPIAAPSTLPEHHGTKPKSAAEKPVSAEEKKNQ